GTFTPGTGTWTFGGASNATIGGAGGTLGSFANMVVAKNSSAVRLSVMRAVTATGQVSVNAGTLSGTGPISGTVAVASGGKVNPGSGPGTLTITNANFSPGGALQLEINDGGPQDGSAAGTNYDLLNVTGTLTLGGSSVLEILPGPGFSTGEVAYRLASWGTIGSPGSGFATIVPGAPFEVRYDNVNKWLNIGNGVVPTPVTIESFEAEAEGLGILLRWRCASEYDNAGFHIWRRPLGAGDDGWRRANALPIPGRATNPNPKEYAWLDAFAYGAFEYRLESESSRGESEFYGKTAKAATIPPWVSPLAAAVSTGMGGFSAAADRVREAAEAAKGEAVRLKVAEAIAAGRSLAPIEVEVVRPSHAPPVGATAASRGVLTGAGPSAAKAAMASAKANIGPADAVKIVTKGRGMVRVDAADIPAGFDPLRVRVLREGEAIRTVAADGNGLVLWAPGYEDAYTDKDAFFLLADSSPTREAGEKKSEGLFASGRKTVTEHVATATIDFHDVYYQWDAALMPYSYPPWFSSKFLSGGTTHEFPITLRAPADGSGKLTVVLFSQSDVPEENPDHSLHVTVNDSLVGTASWDGGGKMLSLTFDVPRKTLRDGVNSIVLRTPSLASGRRVFSFLHSLIVEYRQDLVWGGGTFEVSASRRGVYEVSGLPSGEVWAVRVDDPTDVSGVPWASREGPDGSWTVRFLASKAGRYAICPKGGEATPVSVEARRIEPLAGPLDYLAAGPASFGEAVAPLLEARAAEGMKTAFADQERLFDAHGFGRYGPGGIRNAVMTVRPKFLLLLGRTSFDYRNYLGQNMDMMCPTVLVATSRFGEVNGDPMYGDLGNGYPEVAVGRIPAYTAAEVSSAVARILAHSAGGSN
ncbi:MAG: C25 family cysteine peptidase, partial [Planctomycetota bacterium]|nr:C25 family cysteine peptidase [Planctomycetota bacterium]